MEGRSRWVVLAAVAPILWGATYYVTRHALPADVPFWGAALRALPAGLLLLALVREIPHGAWWWRSCVLGVLNCGAFFVLVYIAAQRLPTSLAATVMALSPTVLVLVSWPLLGRRPRVRAIASGLLGVLGVAVLLGAARPGLVDAAGVAASLGGMLMSSVGYVLAARWGSDGGGPSVLATTSWQLVAGGTLVVPVALVLEGGPPDLDVPAVLGFGYVSFVASALACVAWFTAIRRLGPATVGLVGLLNPVTGVLLGVVVASEVFGAQQFLGLIMTLGAVALGLGLGRCGTRGGSSRRGRHGRPRRRVQHLHEVSVSTDGTPVDA